MLQEKKVVDKIEIIGDFIQVRERNCILKDDIEIASSFHRFVLSKTDKRNELDEQVKKVADAIWGPYEESVQLDPSGSQPTE